MSDTNQNPVENGNGEEEQFMSSEVFEDAESALDWDSLISRGNVNRGQAAMSKWERESLYQRFDPLVGSKRESFVFKAPKPPGPSKTNFNLTVLSEESFFTAAEDLSTRDISTTEDDPKVANDNTNGQNTVSDQLTSINEESVNHSPIPQQLTPMNNDENDPIHNQLESEPQEPVDNMNVIDIDGNGSLSEKFGRLVIVDESLQSISPDQSICMNNFQEEDDDFGNHHNTDVQVTKGADEDGDENNISSKSPSNLTQSADEDGDENNISSKSPSNLTQSADEDRDENNISSKSPSNLTQSADEDRDENNISSKSPTILSQDADDDGVDNNKSFKSPRNLTQGLHEDGDENNTMSSNNSPCDLTQGADEDNTEDNLSSKSPSHLHGVPDHDSSTSSKRLSVSSKSTPNKVDQPIPEPTAPHPFAEDFKEIAVLKKQITALKAGYNELKKQNMLKVATKETELISCREEYVKEHSTFQKLTEDIKSLGCDTVEIKNDVDVAESAFAELHSMYETAKSLQSRIEQNCEVLKQRDMILLQILKLREDRDQLAETEVARIKESMEKDLTKIITEKEAERKRLSALIRMSDMKASNLEEEITQISKENKKMQDFCDELVHQTH